jgi:hypothetical protein
VADYVIFLTTFIYVQSNECSLFCFILFCHIEISQTIVIHVELLVSLESSTWVWVHQFGLRLFWVMVWKLLIIEPFYQWKWHKIEIENYIGILGRSWCYSKVLNKWDLIGFISQFSKPRYGRYWCLNEFCCWNFKKNINFGFGSKNQLSPQCVHIAKFRNFHSKNVKNI